MDLAHCAICQQKPYYLILNKLKLFIRLFGLLMLLFSSGSLLKGGETLRNDDTFWVQAQDTHPFESNFRFKNKARFEDRFSPVAYAVFRFFCITTGSMPLTYLVGSQIYDWSVYAVKRGDPHWQPSWWGWADERLTPREKTMRVGAVIGVTLGSSLFIAFIDCLIYHLTSASRREVKSRWE